MSVESHLPCGTINSRLLRNHMPEHLSVASESMDRPLSSAGFFGSIACLPERLILRIFSFLSIQQLLLLSEVSLATRALAHFYIVRAWNFDRTFRYWFHNPRAFQDLLYRCDGVVSGSQALQFFDRTYYPESDMDIYVRHAKVDVIACWIHGQGYRSIPYSQVCLKDAKPSVYPNAPFPKSRRGSSITTVQNYFRQEILWDGSSVERHIQIIGLCVDPVFHVLFEFHSTAVMNFIAPTVAVSLFPKSTLIDRKSYIVRDDRDNCKKSALWRRKYGHRGFEIIGHGSGVTDRGQLKQLCGHRSVSDRRSWVMPLVAPYNRTEFDRGQENISLPFKVIEIERDSPGGGYDIRLIRPLRRNPTLVIDKRTLGLELVEWVEKQRGPPTSPI